MTDSLIDEAVACCRDVIQELDDGPMRRAFKLRLELRAGLMTYSVGDVR